MNIRSIKYYTKTHPLFRDGLEIKFFSNGLPYLKVDEVVNVFSFNKFWVWLEKKYISTSQKKQPDIDRMFKVICTKMGLNEDAVQGSNRKRELVRARQIGHYLAEKHTDESLSDIGYKIGRKSHCTVLHSKKTIEGFMEIYPTWRDKIIEIENAIL